MAELPGTKAGGAPCSAAPAPPPPPPLASSRGAARPPCSDGSSMSAAACSGAACPACGGNATWGEDWESRTAMGESLPTDGWAVVASAPAGAAAATPQPAAAASAAAATLSPAPGTLLDLDVRGRLAAGWGPSGHAGASAARRASPRPLSPCTASSSGCRAGLQMMSRRPPPPPLLSGPSSARDAGAAASAAARGSAGPLPAPAPVPYVRSCVSSAVLKTSSCGGAPSAWVPNDGGGSPGGPGWSLAAAAALPSRPPSAAAAAAEAATAREPAAMAGGPEPAAEAPPPLAGAPPPLPWGTCAAGPLLATSRLERVMPSPPFPPQAAPCLCAEAPAAPGAMGPGLTRRRASPGALRVPPAAGWRGGGAWPWPAGGTEGSPAPLAGTSPSCAASAASPDGSWLCCC